MNKHADTPSPVASAAPSPEDTPDTDDPVVLRELLRQAREHLRLRESIEQMMAENVARTEALLVEARAAREPQAGADAVALAAAATDARASLERALAAIERLEALLAPAEDATHGAGNNGAHPEPAPPTDPGPEPEPDAPVREPRTIEVLMHQVHTPALARSAQQHLLGTEGVAGAEVRELAEGLLRITVVSTRPITGEALAGWEPGRTRVVRTSSADVLELELEPAGS